jgi:hypothetical protein
LNQNDLDWFAARLSIAVYDVNRISPEMSVLELKAALRDIVGSDQLTISYAPNGNQLIEIDGRTIEVGPMASNDEIRVALQNPFIRTENTKMSITGLQSGAFQEKLAEMRQKIANAQAQGLSKIDGVVTAGTAKLDEAAQGAAAKAQKEIDDALQEFATMTNGGPA